MIYVESRFRDQTSHAGAKGLMQLMPATADYIAHKSGGTEFEQGDLADPQINIAYGSWYLRYLLEHYNGNTALALAAYNAGEGKVDEWWREAADRGEHFRVADHIPFPETRAYVTKVLGRAARVPPRVRARARALAVSATSTFLRLTSPSSALPNSRPRRSARPAGRRPCAASARSR